MSRPSRCWRTVTPAVAWQRAAEWIARDNVWIPLPGPEHPGLLASLLAAPGISGRLMPDAHLAALGVEHGLTLCSTDGDFARFPGLRWQNPFAAGG